MYYGWRYLLSIHLLWVRLKPWPDGHNEHIKDWMLKYAGRAQETHYFPLKNGVSLGQVSALGSLMSIPQQ